LEEKTRKLYELLKDIEAHPPKNFLDPIKKKIENMVNSGREYRLGSLDQIPDMVEVYETKKTPLINSNPVSQILKRGLDTSEHFENQNKEIKY
jgi:hypothetical protein